MLIARPKSVRKRVVVNCQIADAVGELVSIAGPDVGGLWQVQKTQIGSLFAVPAVGVIIVKINPTTAIVQTEGEIDGIFTGLTSGRVYYCSASSIPTMTPPVASIGMPRVYQQTVGVAVSTDKFLLKISPQLSVKIL